MATFFVGIDVCKKHLDLVVLPSGEHRRDTNDLAGCQRIVAFLATLAPSPQAIRVILESTGGLEVAVAVALQTAGMEVAIVRPDRVRSFGQGHGYLAKTDRLDAELLALFGQKVDNLVIYPLPTEELRHLRDLLDRRQQLVAMQTMESNRVATTHDPRAVKSVEKHLDWLAREIGAVEEAIDARIKANPEWEAKDRVLQSIPGVGPQTARLLIGMVPELGHATRQQLGALIGVAPLASESGEHIGERHIRGGRREVRNVLYMAALTASHRNPVCTALYQRLRQRGRESKVALVAVAHKLLTIANAMVRTQTEWRPS